MKKKDIESALIGLGASAVTMLTVAGEPHLCVVVPVVEIAHQKNSDGDKRMRTAARDEHGSPFNPTVLTECHCLRSIADARRTSPHKVMRETVVNLFSYLQSCDFAPDHVACKPGTMVELRDEEWLPTLLGCADDMNVGTILPLRPVGAAGNYLTFDLGRKRWQLCSCDRQDEIPAEGSHVAIVFPNPGFDWNEEEAVA